MAYIRQEYQAHVTAPPRPAWLSHEEYPFESRYLSVGGHLVHYLDEGEGPVLLFVHAPMWSFTFRDLILCLRERYRCITLDLPGTGLSSTAPGYKPRLAEAAVVLEQFICLLDLQDVILIVHDLGGPVSFGAIRHMPQRINGLAMMGTFGWPLDPHPKVLKMLRLVGSAPFRFLNTHFNLLARLSSTSAGVGRRLSPAGKRAFLGPFRAREVRQTTIALLHDAVHSTAFLADVERTLQTSLSHLPVLLAYGEHDPGRQEGFQERFQELYPEARSVVIQGARHFPHTEAPHEMAAHLEAWLDEKVTPAPLAFRPS